MGHDFPSDTRWRWIRGVLALFFLWGAADALAWESDVHFGLTRWLANQAGFNSEYAEAVAAANEDLDRTAASATHLVVTYACIQRDAAMSQLVRRHHFPTYGPIPGLPNERPVEAGGSAAFREIRNEILTQVGSAKQEQVESLRRFGEALHALQDSWSHRGVPDAPGGFLVPCDQKLSWGHPKPRGGYKTHNADHTFRWRNDAIETAKATFYAMREFLTAHPWAGTPPTDNWDYVLKELEPFIKAATRADKWEWFAARGFTQSDFLSGTTLPGGFPASDNFFFAQATPREGTPAALLARQAPADVQGEFERFLRAWLVDGGNEAQLRQLIAFQPMANAMDLKFAKTGPAREAAVSQDLALWRLKDYGTAKPLMDERRSSGIVNMSAAAQMLKRQDALVRYETLTQALQPLDNHERTVLTFALDQPLRTGAGDFANAYAALAKPRHTANTLVVLFGARTPAGFRIVGMQPVLTH